MGFFGDMATIGMQPLLNVLASGFNVPAMVLKVVDCTQRLGEGHKKDGPYIAEKFLPEMERVGPHKNVIDLVFFNGGSNMQLAGRVIKAKSPG